MMKTKNSCRDCKYFGEIGYFGKIFWRTLQKAELIVIDGWSCGEFDYNDEWLEV